MPKNYKESLREEWSDHILNSAGVMTTEEWWLDKLETQVQCAVAEERKRMVEIEKQKLAPITHIHANFNGNGLVEETANKINELVDAINFILTPTSNKK